MFCPLIKTICEGDRCIFHSDKRSDCKLTILVDELISKTTLQNTLAECKIEMYEDDEVRYY